MGKKYHIIGAGVMGRVLAHYLEIKGHKVEVSDCAHSCALNSMPFVSLFGIEEGKSELGNLLLDSYKKFEFYQENFKNPGIKKVKHIIIYKNGEEKYEKRFGPPEYIQFQNLSLAGHQMASFLVNPSIALDHLYSDAKIKIKYLDPQKLNLASDETHYFFCTSSLSNKIWQTNTTSKIVAGSYLEGKCFLGIESFILSSEWGNLIYDHESRLVCLGATSEKEEFCLPDLKKLQSIKSFYIEYFTNLEKVEFRLGVGLRLKGKKRMPRFEKIKENTYLLDSFYKNGWSIPFLFVSKVDAVLS